jgi:hypothetical protein
VTFFASKRICEKAGCRGGFPLRYKRSWPAALCDEEIQMNWELKELEDAVRNTHGARYGEAIREPLQSFSWKSDMAYFHAHEAEQIIKDAVAVTPGINNHDREPLAFAKAVTFSAMPGEDGQLLRLAKFKAEAHIIASAQALHSLCDIVCHVVYWSYQLDTVPKAPKLNKLNPHSILKVLNTLPQYATTASLIQDVIDSPEFEYLVAYVNTTKHKSLISTSMSASFGSEDRGGMRIKSFSYIDQRGNNHHFDVTIQQKNVRTGNFFLDTVF